MWNMFGLVWSKYFPHSPCWPQRLQCLSSPHAFTPSSALVRETRELMGSQFPHLSERESTTDRVLSVSRSIAASFPARNQLVTALNILWQPRSICAGLIKVYWKRRGSERGWSIFKSARISLSARATYVLPLKTRYSTSVCLKNDRIHVSKRKLSRNILERICGQQHWVKLIVLEIFKGRNTKWTLRSEGNHIYAPSVTRLFFADGSFWVSSRNKMGITGYFELQWKCLVVVALRLLFLVPAGVPARSGDSYLKDNITVRQGDSAVLK